MDGLLIELGWKSGVIAGGALAVSWLMRRRAAAERVLLLRIGLAMVLLLPGLVLLVPALEVALLPAPEAALPAPVAAEIAAMRAIAAPEAALNVPSLPDLFGLIYAAGVALVLLHFAAGIITLWRWTRAARPVADRQWADAFARATASLRRPARLRVSASVATPLSWGLAPAWVLIGPELERTPSEAEAVVAHELAHVRRLDWLVLVGSRLATALYWCNPVIWLLDRALAREAELAADDAAIRHVAPADYAQTLLAVAAPSGRYPACGMAVDHGTLARRIRHLLEKRARRRASPLLSVALLLGVPLAAVPLAAARVVPAKSSGRTEAKVARTTLGQPVSRIVAKAVATKTPVPAPAVRIATAAVPPPRVRAALATAVMPPSRVRATPDNSVESAAPSAAVELPAAQPPERARPASPLPAAAERRISRITAEVGRPPVPARFWDSLAASLRPDRSEQGRPDQDSEEDASKEPQGASRLQRMRRWIDRLRSEAGRLENAARYYPTSSDVRTAYIKAASDARRQAQMLERDMEKLNPGQ